MSVLNKDYKNKYNKYKLKYLQLKKQIDTENIKIQQGGILNIFEQIGFSCNQYYNNTNMYSFSNFDELKQFLINFSKYNNLNNYDDTILYELIKINFDIKNKFNELPELIKLLLHLRPKPAHLLEFLFDKDFTTDIKAVLTNTYISKSNLSFSQLIDFKNIPPSSIRDAIMVLLNGFLHGTKLYGYEVTKGGINKEVLRSLNKILMIESSDDLTNIWNALDKLLEFVSCILDSKIFSYFGIKIEDYTKILDEQIIKIVFIDEIIKYQSKRKFSNFYKNTETSKEIKLNYNNFILMDFLNPDKNIEFILPPSVLLFLSIKINPILNDSNYWMNNSLRYFIEYITNKSCNYQDEEITKKVEEYIEQNSSKEINLSQSDSNLIDTALISLTNGSDKELTNQEITSSNSLLTEAGIKYVQIMNNITDKIKKNIYNGLSTFDIFNSINVFELTSPSIRKKKLDDRIKYLDVKLVKLKSDYEKASPSKKMLGWFSSDKEVIKDKIEKNELKINNAKLELNELDKVINNTDKIRIEKLNYILSKIILFAGLGINEISKDVCTIDKKSTINWKTFNKLLKILDNKLFKIINLASSNVIKHSIIQYIVPYSIYLHLDLNRFFHSKLNLNKEQSNQFDNWYKEYEIRIYEKFTNNSDGFYYPETDNKKNTYALFPSTELLNSIKDSINS